MNYVTSYLSPVGCIALASDGEALTGLRFEGQDHFGYPDPVSSEAEVPVFEEAKRWLDAYFSGQDPGISPPLRFQGTVFRKRVWELLLGIPYGTAVTYGEIASMIAGGDGPGRKSAQAVGGAVGHNPIAIMIPCHRVIGSDGSLTGYSGGLERKRYLLELEGIIL